MKKLLLPEFLLLITIYTLPAQSTPLSSNLFIQKETETYQCIQIRRGDIITLTGYIEMIDGETNSDQKNLSFTSLGGRTFILKGDLVQKITNFYSTLPGSENIILVGKVLFEGLEEIPAQMEVISYKSPNSN